MKGEKVEEVCTSTSTCTASFFTIKRNLIQKFLVSKHSLRTFSSSCTFYPLFLFSSSYSHSDSVLYNNSTFYTEGSKKAELIEWRRISKNGFMCKNLRRKRYILYFTLLQLHQNIKLSFSLVLTVPKGRRSIIIISLNILERGWHYICCFFLA